MDSATRLTGNRGAQPFVARFADGRVARSQDPRIEEQAREVFEIAVWPDGRRCPFCASSRVRALGKHTRRPGSFRCGRCRRAFLVTSGTLFSRTHVPLAKWLSAFCIVVAAPSHVSARKLHIEINTSYQTAWTMAKKIRRCLAQVDRRFGITADLEARVLRAIRAAVPSGRPENAEDGTGSRSGRKSVPWARFGALGLHWLSSMKPAAPDFIQKEPRLQGAIDAACADSKSAVCVVLVSEKGLRTASYDGGDCGSPRFDEFTSVPASCMSKPISAMLLAHALEKRHVPFDADAYEVVQKVLDRRFELLRGVKLHQLLTHTHGMDAPLMTPPSTGQAHIDPEATYSVIERSGRLSAPAENLFSYGGAGLWIAASLIEGIHERSYTERVGELLPTAVERCEGGICPSTGGPLELNAIELASIIALQFDTAASAVLRTVRTGFAGWAPLRIGAHMGWFDHGTGWLGHNGQSHGGMIMVRFHPGRKLGIVVTSNDDTLAGKVITQLFKKMLPELNNWPDVQRIAGEELERLNLSRFEGEYANAFGRATVSRESRNQLSMAFDWGGNGRTQEPVQIHPARLTNGHFIFMMIPNLEPFNGVIQFLRPLANSQFRFLWDGRKLWRNLGFAS